MITLDIPISQQYSSQRGNIDDIDQYIEQYASDPNREWSWTDPLRESASSIINSFFGTSNMELNYLQSIKGLDDNQFREAIKSGQVKIGDRLLSRLPQEMRDKAIQEEIDASISANQWIDSINPAPHRDPEGLLENAADTVLNFLPQGVVGAAEYYMLGPAGTAALSTYQGNQSSKKQVYDNLRNQGYSHEEAYEKATGMGGNYVDAGIRAATNFLTMRALGKPINPQLNPLGQVAGNIGRGMLYSGVGGAGEQALTDYRSERDFDLGDTARAGIGAAGATGLMGVLNAVMNGRKLYDMQKRYNANRPIDVDYTEGGLYPELPEGRRALGAGEGTGNPNVPPNSPNTQPPAPNGNTLALPSAKDRWDNVFAKHGIPKGTPIESLSTAVQYGRLSPQEVEQIVAEAGENPIVAKYIIDRGFEWRDAELAQYKPKVSKGDFTNKVGVQKDLDTFRKPKVYKGDINNPILQPPSYGNDIAPDLSGETRTNLPSETEAIQNRIDELTREAERLPLLTSKREKIIDEINSLKTELQEKSETPTLETPPEANLLPFDTQEGQGNSGGVADPFTYAPFRENPSALTVPPQAREYGHARGNGTQAEPNTPPTSISSNNGNAESLTQYLPAIPPQRAERSDTHGRPSINSQPQHPQSGQIPRGYTPPIGRQTTPPVPQSVGNITGTDNTPIDAEFVDESDPLRMWNEHGDEMLNAYNNSPKPPKPQLRSKNQKGNNDLAKDLGYSNDYLDKKQTPLMLPSGLTDNSEQSNYDIERPGVRHSSPAINKPNTEHDKPYISKPNVIRDKNIFSGIKKPTIHKDPLDLDILQPPEYNLTPMSNEDVDVNTNKPTSNEEYDDEYDKEGYIGEFDVIHANKVPKGLDARGRVLFREPTNSEATHSVRLYEGAFDTPEEIEDYGKSRYEFYNDDGDMVAFYAPEVDEFVFNPEFEHTAWVRRIPEFSQQNYPDLFPIVEDKKKSNAIEDDVSDEEEDDEDDIIPDEQPIVQATRPISQQSSRPVQERRRTVDLIPPEITYNVDDTEIPEGISKEQFKKDYLRLRNENKLNYNSAIDAISKAINGELSDDLYDMFKLGHLRNKKRNNTSKQQSNNTSSSIPKADTTSKSDNDTSNNVIIPASILAKELGMSDEEYTKEFNRLKSFMGIKDLENNERLNRIRNEKVENTLNMALAGTLSDNNYENYRLNHLRDYAKNHGSTNDTSDDETETKQADTTSKNDEWTDLLQEFQKVKRLLDKAKKGTKEYDRLKKRYDKLAKQVAEQLNNGSIEDTYGVTLSDTEETNDNDDTQSTTYDIDETDEDDYDEDYEDNEDDNDSEYSDYAKAGLKIAKRIKWGLEHRNADTKLTNKELFKIAEEAFGGTMGDGAFTPKDAYDAMELGVNMYIMEHDLFPDDDGTAESIDELKSTFVKLSSILDYLPTQANRTGEQNEYQQFSTPPTLGFIVNWLASIISTEDIILEPSAGLGGLACFNQSAGEDGRIILNELSDRRAELLETLGLGKVYRVNAEQINNILAHRLKSDERPTKVIMNPPFSATAGRIKGQRDNKNAMQHVEQALKLLQPNGRLVTILGKGMAEGNAKADKWWKHIKKTYNVRVNLSLNGKNYKKYGTTFDNVIAIIDKTGATPNEGTYIKSFENLEDIFDDKTLRDIVAEDEYHDVNKFYDEDEYSSPTEEKPSVSTQPQSSEATQSKKEIREGARSTLPVKGNIRVWKTADKKKYSTINIEASKKEEDKYSLKDTLTNKELGLYNSLNNTLYLDNDLFDNELNHSFGVDNEYVNRLRDKFIKYANKNGVDVSGIEVVRGLGNYGKTDVEPEKFSENEDTPSPHLSTTSGSSVKVKDKLTQIPKFASSSKMKELAENNAKILEKYTNPQSLKDLLSAVDTTTLKITGMAVNPKLYWGENAPRNKIINDIVSEIIKKVAPKPKPAPTPKVGSKKNDYIPKTEKEIKNLIKDQLLSLTYKDTSSSGTYHGFNAEHAEYATRLTVAAMKRFSQYMQLPLDDIYNAWNLQIVDKNVSQSDVYDKVAGYALVTPSKSLIAILIPTHNVYPHELAHVFLDQFLNIVRNKWDKISQQAKNDWNTIVDELGLWDIDFKTLNENDKNYKKWCDMHEAFAQSFNKYLMRGEAPSSDWVSVFEFYKKWLTDLFGTTDNIRYHDSEDWRKTYPFQLSDELAELFDKVLTAQDEKPTTLKEERERNKSVTKSKSSKEDEETSPQQRTSKNRTFDDIRKTSKPIHASVKSDRERAVENKADFEYEKKYMDRLKPTEKEQDPDIEDTELNVFGNYHPTIKFSEAKHHPADLVESEAMKSVKMPPLTYSPHIPEDVVENGALSDAQLEVVAYAGQSFTHKNANGERRGYYIGDGTGVGKGREISGIIMDTMSQGFGNGKAIWISDKHELIKDAKRDWSGLGNNPDFIFPHENINKNNPINKDEGIIFTSYSYMTKDRINQLKQWLGEDYDGIIVLDECHNANNVLDKKSGFGTKKASSTGINTRDFIKEFPDARVVYVSATGATNVDNLAMLDRLGLWGSGTQFSNAREFTEQISKGGVAAMELVARDMKAMGLFQARSLSMRAGPYGGDEDVTFRTVEHQLSPRQQAIYDKLSDAWHIIFQRMDVAIEMCGGESKRGIGSAKAKFYNLQQSFFNQVLLTMQAPSMIKDIERQLDNGNSIIIQLTSTFEANQKRAVQKLRGDDNKSIDNDEYAFDDLDISPKDMLINFLEKTFPVEQNETYEDEEGNIKVRPVTDENGKPVTNPDAVKLRNQLVEEINSINDFPESPLDLIIDHFGAEEVAEITGRSQRFVRNAEGHRVLEKRSDKKVRAEVNDFNEGKKRILLFSEKGGTGASYHASREYDNQQKRIHYLYQPGWRADKAIQGLGRSHRSNEAHKPEYVLVTTNVPGQKRFISTIARRLEEMGALTKGDRKSAGNGIFSENDNLESPYIQNALEDTLRDISRGTYPEFPDPAKLIDDLGLPQDMFDAGNRSKIPNVTRFLNRMLAVDVNTQRQLYNRFEEHIEKRKALAIARNELDVRTENITAQEVKILKNIVIKKNNEWGTETRYLELELVKPLNGRTFDNVTRVRGATEFYTDDLGNILAACPRQRTKTDIETGDTSQAFALYSVNPNFYDEKPSHILANQSSRQIRHYTKITREEAKKVWEKQLSNLPKTYSEKKYMIAGAMLPIWKSLQGQPRIQRVITEKGQSYLGRIIPEKDLQTTLTMLGVGYKKDNKEWSGEQLRNHLNENPIMVATLTNNSKIRVGRLYGEKVFVFDNIDFYTAKQLKQWGVNEQFVNGKPFYFIGMSSKADSVLDKIFTEYPVVRVINGRGNGEDDIINDAINEINNEISSDDAEKLHAIPRFFRPNPDENPNIHSSRYAFSEDKTEEEWQKSKRVPKRNPLSDVMDFAKKVWKNTSDIPELEGDNNLIKAKERTRKLKREMKATVSEVIQALKIITTKLTPDDYDLFDRAMVLMDLVETHRLDPEVQLPYEYNSETLAHDYNNIMKEVRKNARVQSAIEKAEAVGEQIRKKLLDAAEELGMYDMAERLSREHYFRHVVIEHKNFSGSGQPRQIFKNPERRGYMKHREGSTKNIISDWITAMGEVYVNMTNDTKILNTLIGFKQEYDIIDSLKARAFEMNKQNALYAIMQDLKDVPLWDREKKAHENLEATLNHRQSTALAKLFKIAKDGDLPAGEDNQWGELIYTLAKAETLEKLTPKQRTLLSRYIGWLAGVDSESPAVNAAKRFLRGDVGKQAGLKKILGDRYIKWQNLIPDDYELWSPSDSKLVFNASTVSENMLLLAQENIDELLGIPLSEIGKMLNAGGDKQLWCIPSKLAEALNSLGKKNTMGSFGKFNKKLMSAFKKWVLLSPFGGRIVKYNERNFFGDFEAVLQGNPGAIYYVRQAWRELSDYIYRGKIPTGMLAEFIKRGGAITTEFASEIENWEDLDEFKNLLQKSKHIDILKMPGKFVKGYVKMASAFTTFRESILRYASFLSYAKLIQDNNGEVPFYGMSKKEEVDALQGEVLDMAFKLANESLGAYDQISKNAEWLRDNSILSFVSWIEVNFTRTIQMYKNIWSGNNYLEWWIKKHGNNFISRMGGGGGNGKEPPRGSNNGGDFFEDDNGIGKIFKGLKKTPTVALRVAITLALSFPLWIMLGIINHINSKNDEKLSPEIRSQPHLTLGTNPYTQETYYLSNLGSMVDFFETVPIDVVIKDTKKLLDGKITVGEMISDTAGSPINKILNSTNPYAKAIFELISGKRFFPDFRNASNIRDKGNYLAQTLGLEWYYNLLMGKPHADGSHLYNYGTTFANAQKSDEAAYWYILGRKKEFQKTILGREFNGYTETQTGEALYYARRAASYGDYDKMKKYLKQYYKSGGTREGIKDSVRAISPMHGLNEIEEKRFIKWLPQEERRLLKQAMKYSIKIQRAMSF